MNQIAVVRKNWGITGAMMLLMLALLASGGWANIIIVTSADDNTTGDGQVTLREAIEAANTDASVDGSNTGSGADTIVFATALRGSTIELGIDGDNTFEDSALDISTDVTIWGSTQSGITITRNIASPEMRLFYVQTTGDLTLRNLTLTGGRALGDDGSDSGGGGTGGGGAGLGGAIYAAGPVTILRCTLSDNRAIGGDAGEQPPGSTSGSSGGGPNGGSGGAFGSPGGHGNPGGFGSGGGGGGNSWGGVAGDGGEGGFGGGGGGGGGNSLGGGTTGSHGAEGGGGGDGDNGTGNYGGRGGAGAGLGGAIFVDDTTLTVRNSTLYANRAQGGTDVNAGSGCGGAIFNRNGTLDIINTTIASNEADNGGGGIYNLGDGSAANASIDNTIIGDTSGGAADFRSTLINAGSHSATGVGNIFESGSGFSGTIVSTLDPQLNAIGDYGGPTQTLSLPNVSNARNAGNNAAATGAGLTGDQRGASRFNGIVDIGAYEFLPQTGVDLAITKTNGVPGLLPGQAVTYTIVATNLGGTDVFAAEVADTITTALDPSSWEVTTVDSGCHTTEVAGTGNISTIVDLAAGSSITFKIYGVVTTSAAATNIANTATITKPTNVDPTLLNNTATDDDPIFRPDIVVTKTSSAASPSFVAAGDPVTFTITVTNAGSAEATNVEVTDTFEEGIIYQSNSCGAPVVSDEMTWTIGTLASGEVVSCEITATLASCTTYWNAATATLTETESNSANNTDALLINEILSVVRDGGFELGTPNPAWGEASTNFGTPLCTIGACGTGTGTGPHGGDFWAWFGGIPAFEEGAVSQEVFIPANSTAILKFYFEYPATSGAATDEIVVALDGTPLWIFTADALPFIGYQPIAIDVTSFADGISHELAFESITQNGINANFFIDNVSIVPCAIESDLQIEKIDSADPVAVGGAFAYTLSVFNAGPSSADNVSVEDILPTGITYVSSTLSQGALSDSGQDLMWNIGTLADGTGVSAEINVTAGQAAVGMVSNVASIEFPGTDPVLANNVSSETTVITAPEIDVTPAPLDFGPRVITAGPTAPIGVTIENVGTAPLSFNGIGITITGADAADFSITNAPPTTQIGAGGNRLVQVDFDPSSVGPKAANLQITTDDFDEPVVNIPLTGTGTDASPNQDIDVLPVSLDFGARGVADGPAPSQNVTIQNVGSHNHTYTGNCVEVTGAASPEFYVDADSRESPLTPGGTSR
ncbi:MAG: DUF11 domain-containing protein, partial [bacterium]|nr:DUF11 domain-containing protein [bacterium]